MKTIEQILEGVTAGGQWDAEGCFIAIQSEADAAYAARAARNFPALVKALQNLHYAVASESLNHPDLDVRLAAINAAHRATIESQAVLTEALKD